MSEVPTRTIEVRQDSAVLNEFNPRIRLIIEKLFHKVNTLVGEYPDHPIHRQTPRRNTPMMVRTKVEAGCTLVRVRFPYSKTTMYLVHNTVDGTIKYCATRRTEDIVQNIDKLVNIVSYGTFDSNDSDDMALWLEDTITYSLALKPLETNNPKVTTNMVGVGVNPITVDPQTNLFYDRIISADIISNSFPSKIQLTEHGYRAKDYIVSTKPVSPANVKVAVVCASGVSHTIEMQNDLPLGKLVGTTFMVNNLYGRITPLKYTVLSSISVNEIL